MDSNYSAGFAIEKNEWAWDAYIIDEQPRGCSKRRLVTEVVWRKNGSNNSSIQ